MDLTSLSRPGWVPVLCAADAVTAYLILRQDESVGAEGRRLLGLSVATAIIGGVWFRVVAAFTVQGWMAPAFGILSSREVGGSVVLGALAWAIVPWAFVAWRLSTTFEMLWDHAGRSALRLCAYLGAVSVMVATVQVALG